EGAVEVDDLGVRVQRPPWLLGAEPHHGAVGDRHGGGIRGTRAVETAADEQLGSHGCPVCRMAGIGPSPGLCRAEGPTPRAGAAAQARSMARRPVSRPSSYHCRTTTPSTTSP